MKNFERATLAFTEASKLYEQFKADLAIKTNGSSDQRKVWRVGMHKAKVSRDNARAILDLFTNPKANPLPKPKQLSLYA